jgi:glyceraldehyde-3-phosphate dehydrogenase (NADP+)
MSSSAKPAEKKLAPAGISADAPEWASKPMVVAGRFMAGKKSEWTGATTTVTSPIYDTATSARAIIGTLPDMAESDAVEAVEAAAAAWDKGQGVWPQMSLSSRIAAIENLVTELGKVRSSMVNALIWEIAKSSKDAAAEFDRTIVFIKAAIAELKKDPTIGQGFSQWSEVSGFGVKTRRGPIGVMLGLAPFNYPLNEMYAMLIPALLMGNVAVLKLPAIGGLVHVLTADAIAAALPAGVVNFVSGAGRKTMGPIMATGLVDVLGFIGGTRGADALIKAHPAPHRLKVFAQLEGKNMGIVLPDADLEVAASACVTGALSYNGQRCTAVKLIMVHDSVADAFMQKLLPKVAALKVGLPWEGGVNITPLPEPTKPGVLADLIADATSKGADLVNADIGGGELRGALYTPAVVDRVDPSMRLFVEEQFGPCVPVARFTDVSEVQAGLKASWNGQQASIFTSSSEAAAPLVDTLSSIVGRININAQCGRSPDVVPFSGRRSSAMGTMSVAEALRSFSIETVVAYPTSHAPSKQVATGLDRVTQFFAPVGDSPSSGMPRAIADGLLSITAAAVAWGTYALFSK